ncbi:MAG TPA: NADH-ubiquinone oxidoreductase-F iron-sulfur binding region domain-containing protein [Candidatus Dormibacteraeota bacterium]
MTGRLRLLAGPDLAAGAESLNSHVQRLGPLPSTGKAFVDVVERSGLTGRGGAGFPVGRKWRSVAASGGETMLVVNGAEGEPQSMKDRVLMATRPHLVLDGALVAARGVGAKQLAVVVGEAHTQAYMAMAAALAQRPEPFLRQARLLGAPARYVAGESSAVAHLVAEGVARPTSRPPSPHQSGLLIQNVETLGHVALVARYGAEWFRSNPTVLVTAAGAVTAPGVLEVTQRTSVREVFELAGGGPRPIKSLLFGGYFGAWSHADGAWDLPLEPAALRDRGLTLGCGVVGFLHDVGCGVCETARIMRYLATESSAQCGPCFFGLRALADATGRIAERGTNPDDVARLRRWSEEIGGRGACRHPDGAVMFLRSALDVFGTDFANHPPHWRARVA